MKSSDRPFEAQQGAVLGSSMITKLSSSQHPTVLLVDSRHKTLENWLG
jgi:hypothetical protein